MNQLSYEWIRENALDIGFSDCGISLISPLSEEAKRLDEWLQASYHSGMGYMNNNKDKRVEADKLVPESKSVISVILNYYNDVPAPKEGQAIVSKYALGRDYHKVLKKMLKTLFFRIKAVYPQLEGRYFTDSAPVMEKTWLSRSGLAWQGKNGNAISRTHGSFFFIGEIISNLEIEVKNTLSKNYCGSCSRCIEACPTQAIVRPFVVDANKCISYQTIENKAPIPKEMLPQIGNRVFGCDTCQDVCPWNRKLKITDCADFRPREAIRNLSLKELATIDEAQFDTYFNGSAIRRAGHQKLRQTALQILDLDIDF